MKEHLAAIEELRRFQDQLLKEHCEVKVTAAPEKKTSARETEIHKDDD